MGMNGDLIIITVDCMRADFVNEEITPAIYSFGSAGTAYASAYANGCGTPDSFPALFASRLARPFAHHPDFDADSEYSLELSDLTLTEVLVDAGYETAAFVARLREEMNLVYSSGGAALYYWPSAPRSCASRYESCGPY